MHEGKGPPPSLNNLVNCKHDGPELKMLPRCHTVSWSSQIRVSGSVSNNEALDLGPRSIHVIMMDHGTGKLTKKKKRSGVRQ